MEKEINVSVDYDTYIDKDGEEYVDGYTITFNDEDGEMAEQYKQIGQLNCEEECMGVDDYNECFERCMEDYL